MTLFLYKEDSECVRFRSLGAQHLKSFDPRPQLSARPTMSRSLSSLAVSASIVSSSSSVLGLRFRLRMYWSRASAEGGCA